MVIAAGSVRRTWFPAARPSTPLTRPAGILVWPCTYVHVPLSDEESIGVPSASDNVYCRHTVFPACTYCVMGTSHVQGCGVSTGSPAAFHSLKPPDR